MGHQPFSLLILPSYHTFFIVWILTKLGPNLDGTILVWASLQVVQRSDKNEALTAIYDIATPFYTCKTIMSLLNIKKYTKILQQSTCVKFKYYLVCKSVSAGERYRTTMVLLFPSQSLWETPDFFVEYF